MSISLKGFRKINVLGEDFLWKVRKKISHEEWHNDQLAIPVMHVSGGQIFLAYVGYSRSGYGEYTLEAITPAMIRKCILEAIAGGWQYKVVGPAVTFAGGVLTTDVRYGGDTIHLYHLTRTCSACHNQDIFNFSKKEMAFELYDTYELLKTPCSKCGSTESKSLSSYGPEIDGELLDIWGNDESLHFMEQDEELILGDVRYFHLLLKAIDADQYLKSKIGVLIEAICIMIYDCERRVLDPQERTRSKHRKANCSGGESCTC